MSKRDTEAMRRTLTLFKPGAYDDLAPPFDFIPGLLQDHSVAMIYGPPQSGKTFFALHLLCSAGLGRVVFGLPVERRVGLYIGLEGEAGIKARIMAWCAHNGAERSPIHYGIGSFEIADPDQRAALITYMQKHGVQFVVIDTLSRTMTGASENTAEEMSPVIDALHDIKSQTGACVVAITHTGKDTRAGIRGWSGQLGNADTAIELECQVQSAADDITVTTQRMARVRKQRDGEAGNRVFFRLALHETPVTNARGESVRSVALEEHEQFADLTAPAAPKLSRQTRDALAVFDKLKARHERYGRPAPTVSQFRKALRDAKWGPDSEASWRKAWERLIAKIDVDTNDAVVCAPSVTS